MYWHFGLGVGRAGSEVAALLAISSPTPCCGGCFVDILGRGVGKQTGLSRMSILYCSSVRSRLSETVCDRLAV